MKLSPEQKGIVKDCLNLIDSVNDAEIIDELSDIYEKRELSKDNPALTAFQCNFLLTVLCFWNNIYEKREVDDLIDKLSNHRTVMTTLGSLLNNRIYGLDYDERKDHRIQNPEFYDKLAPFVNAVADIFTKGEAWAQANERFIQLLGWANAQGWNVSFLLKWYKDIEDLVLQDSTEGWERGDIYSFNSAVAQE